MFSTVNFALVGLIAALSVPALAAEPASNASAAPSVNASASVNGTASANTASANTAAADDATSATEEAGDDQGPPLLFGKSLDVGGYGGLDVAYSRMFGRDGVVAGAQGAVLINHRLALGIAGYGWSNPLDGPAAPNGDAQRFETGYGGFTAHYSLYFDQLPIYFTVGALVGGGAIDLTDENHSDSFDGFQDRPSEDVFAVFQPDVAVHANLTKWMRVVLTAGYRLTSGVDRLGFKEADVNGLMLGGQIQFGAF
jgi:hypothetical protein